MNGARVFHRRFGARRHAAGFSLVELLVALVLAGLVLTALAMATRQWLPNWHRGIDRVETSEAIALALDRVAADLSAVEFVPATRERPRPLFDGLASSIVFVRSAFGPNARPGLEIVRLAETDGSGGAALTRSAAPYVPRDADSPPAQFAAPVVLLRPPYRVSFSYAGRDGLWSDQWRELDELPRAVRLVVRDGATGRALDVSTSIALRAELPASCVSNPQQPGCGGSEPPEATGGGDAAQGKTQ
ncbi:prepilin-type N-terminal cleavage/methylation domain-containing protein [Xanthobacter dioxanivorans]|uniref:Prepilin-type N-terminal cleavage/methylation domain-containing protein n=1 Tax=Xanthobacter dioxanivorans TaxID=2528964 RepID=A0A974SH95_9HYPH|nr:prepilin-type N-terminal cleavage/methylation domain-containing protein [Xanthobacter dioxanivorans]QRG06041.1 prepilin-type N-terminal cleavage/methylation domain-containing protein [Xanthobacter dioxanivorans]